MRVDVLCGLIFAFFVIFCFALAAVSDSVPNEFEEHDDYYDPDASGLLEED